MAHLRAEDVADHLHAKRKGSGWVARCPSHEDRTPSLSIGEGSDGRGLLHCYAGCSFPQICDAAGLERRALGKPAQEPRKDLEEAVTYQYRDENGALLFEVVRYVPKAFRQRRPDGAGGW